MEARWSYYGGSEMVLGTPRSKQTQPPHVHSSLATNLHVYGTLA